MQDHTKYRKVTNECDNDDEETLGKNVHAHHKISLFDGLDVIDNSITPEEEEIEERPRRTVRVVAPGDLPPGYKLEVKSLEDGSCFDVVIPARGVYRGEEFIAEEFCRSPILGHWSDTILDFCTGGEGNMFICACCCPFIAWASVMDRLGLTWYASSNNNKDKPSRISTFVIVTTIGALAAFCLLSRFLPGFYILGIFFICVETRTRMFVREKYNIKGGCFMDFCCNICCGCCSVLQIFRHMKRSGERPMSFSTKKDVSADIVGSFV